MSEARALALFDYKPKKSKELELVRNDVIVILEKKPSGWWYGRSERTKELGVFPSNFVAEELCHCRTQYSYEATKPSRLSFDKHETLVVFAKPDSGWWKGCKMDGTVGLFPKNFVEELPSGAEKQGNAAGVDGGSGSENDGSAPQPEATLPAASSNSTAAVAAGSTEGTISSDKAPGQLNGGGSPAKSASRSTKSRKKSGGAGSSSRTKSSKRSHSSAAVAASEPSMASGASARAKRHSHHRHAEQEPVTAVAAASSSAGVAEPGEATVSGKAAKPALPATPANLSEPSIVPKPALRRGRSRTSGLEVKSSPAPARRSRSSTREAIDLPVDGTPGDKPPLPPQSTIAAVSATTANSQPKETVLCLYDYVAQRDKELSFHKNDVIQVLKKRESGWWLGSLHGRHGRFPRNLTKLIRQRRTTAGSAAAGAAVSDGDRSDSDSEGVDDLAAPSSASLANAPASRKGAARRGSSSAVADDASTESEEEERDHRVNEEAMLAMFARLKNAGGLGDAATGGGGGHKLRASEPSMGTVVGPKSSSSSSPTTSPAATLSARQAKQLRRKAERDAALGGAGKSTAARKHLTLGGKVEGAAGALVLAEAREHRKRTSLAGTLDDSGLTGTHRSASLQNSFEIGRGAGSASDRRVGKRGELKPDRHLHKKRPSMLSLRADGAGVNGSPPANNDDDRKFEPGDKLLAVYDFDGQSRPNSVSLTKGETLTVVRELTDDWIHARKADGSEGAVPRQFVRAIVKSMKAQALFQFDATKRRHLPLKQGDIITVIQSHKAWWDGLCGGRFGSFPSNFVRLLTVDEIAKLEAGELDDYDEDDESTVTADDEDDDDDDDGSASARASRRSRASSTTGGRPKSMSVSGQRAAQGKPRLFHVKGKELIVVTKTVLSGRSLNDGDVFVLDTGFAFGVVFLWNGTYARPTERRIGLYFASCLAEELGAELKVLEKGHELAGFWDPLGGPGPVLSAAEGGDDDEVAKRLLGARRLYRVELLSSETPHSSKDQSSTETVVQGGGGRLVELTDVDRLRMSRSVLQPETAYVLDAGCEVFVWVGSLAPAPERAASLACAEQLVVGRPPHVSLTFVAERGELAFFKQQFDDWQDKRVMAQAQAGTVAPSFDLTLPTAGSPANGQSVASASTVTADQDPVRVACKKFNNKPATGIKFGVQKRLFKRVPEEVAQFLWDKRETFLNKTVLGEYLSDRDEFQAAVLDAFCSHFSLAGHEFDQALREFLQHYRMPGEAQKIERVMEKFARKFTGENPECAISEDTCFVLSYATIMLNTDLHNPAIKKQNKMTKDQFVQRNLALATDLTVPFLERIYDNIAVNEIRLDEGFGDEEKSGWLQLRKGTGRFARKWFVLSNNNLYYFHDPKEQSPSFILPLEALEVRPTKVLGAKFAFEVFDSTTSYLKCCKLNNGMLIEAKFKSLILAADTQDDLDSWIAAVGSCVLSNPFYFILKKRLDESMN